MALAGAGLVPLRTERNAIETEARVIVQDSPSRYLSLMQVAWALGHIITLVSNDLENDISLGPRSDRSPKPRMRCRGKRAGWATSPYSARPPGQRARTKECDNIDLKHMLSEGAEVHCRPAASRATCIGRGALTQVRRSAAITSRTN
jgi:hypothetical protein